MSDSKPRRTLRLATDRFKLSGATSDGQNVTNLAEEVRLAEIALDGATEQLERLNQPVQVTADPAIRRDLTIARKEIVRLRDQRHKAHQDRIDAIRKECAGMSEEHIKIVINNRNGSTEYMRRRDDQKDAEALARIDAQLGTPPATSPAPASASPVVASPRTPRAAEPARASAGTPVSGPSSPTSPTGNGPQAA